MGHGRHRHEKIYRARDGKLLGVCKGIADSFDLSVDGVRLVTILLALFTGFVPVLIIYLLLAVLLEPDPYSHNGNRSRSRKRQATAEDLKSEFDDIKRRVNNMEDDVFDKEKDWDDRFKNE